MVDLEDLVVLLVLVVSHNVTVVMVLGLSSILISHLEEFF